MITDEMEHKIGVSQSLSSVQSKDEERRELEELTRQYLEAGGTIKRLDPEDCSEDAKRFFNNQGPINPAKHQKRWQNDGIAKNFQAQ